MALHARQASPPFLPVCLICIAPMLCLLPGRSKAVEKEYLAVVAGNPAWDEIVVDAPIDRNEDDK